MKAGRFTDRRLLQRTDRFQQLKVVLLEELFGLVLRAVELRHQNPDGSSDELLVDARQVDHAGAANFTEQDVATIRGHGSCAIAIVGFLAAIGGFSHGFSQSNTAAKPISVFILSGQSNMEGVGGSGALPPELASQPDVQIWSAMLSDPDPKAWKPLVGGFGVGKGLIDECDVCFEQKIKVSMSSSFPGTIRYMTKPEWEHFPSAESAAYEGPITVDDTMTVSARHVKVNMLVNSANVGVHINELMVYETESE